MSWEPAAGDKAQEHLLEVQDCREEAPSRSSRHSRDLPLVPTDGRHPATQRSGIPVQRSLLKPKAVAFGMKVETCSTGFCPSLCSLHVCKNEAKKGNHMSSIRLHLFPPKYHSGQYLSVRVNPNSHLSLAHGKLCWT